jgi:hypothetical protein
VHPWDFMGAWRSGPRETSPKLTPQLPLTQRLVPPRWLRLRPCIVRRFARAAALVGRIVTHPPLLTERLHPARVVEALADRGHAARTSTGADLNQIIAAVVPPVVYEVLDNLDLTELVLERVDIDTVVSAVDVEAIVDRVDIAAIVERLDIDAIVSNVDIDAIVRKMNIDAIASQLDIDAIVSRVDVDAIVSRLDVDAIA